jgi:cysteinyl-tRNA synthetase
LQKYPPLAIRFFILTSHYRSPLDFSEEALSGAARGLERLHGTVRLVRAQLHLCLRHRCRQTAPPGKPDPATEEMLARYKAEFLEAMDDDFNTAAAIGVLFDLNREVNALLNAESPVTQGTLAAVDGLYRELGGGILGIIPEELEELGGGLEGPLIGLLIEVRQRLRESRQWELSDGIRGRLGELGIALEDRPEGTTWRLAARGVEGS